MHTIFDLRVGTGECARAVFFSVLWVAMASAMLVESDVYRYATVALVILALVSYRTDVRWISRDWLALLCYVWAIYAVGRFAYGVFVFGEKGASEWLYAFPIFFPLIGVALYKTRGYVFSAATLLVVCGLVGLILTLDFPTLLAGERAAPFFHHNPIHAGIGSCMLFLTVVFWLFYAAETGRLRGVMRWFFLPIGVTTAILSLVGALGSHSKGAWLALAATVAFMGGLSLLRYAGRWRLYLLTGLLVAAVAATMVAAPYVEKVAGPTMDAAAKLTGDTIATEGPLAAMQRAITDPATPLSMRERLELWSNAIELIQAAPWVGWGNEWLRKWYETTYSDVGYTLIHNGYLEIMVRHGLLGMAFLLVFAGAAFHRTNDVHRRGIISSSLAAYIYSLSFFFFWTIATNSNNRLALGESFFILVAAAVFSFTFADRKEGRERV